jgi:hypothetical protein
MRNLRICPNVAWHRNKKKRLLNALDQRMAMQIHRESQETGGDERTVVRQEGEEDFNDIIIRRNNEEFPGSREERRRPFKPSWRWRGKFMKRNRLSKRKPHAKWRTSVNLEDIERHKGRMQNVSLLTISNLGPEEGSTQFGPWIKTHQWRI